MDFMGYFVDWLLLVPTQVYTAVTRALVVYDPLRTVQEYLVDLINDNGLILEKLTHIEFLLTDTNNILLQINYLLWWLLLIGFIAFCGWIVKTLIYGMLSALKI